jgi:hypothetical protein
MNHRLGFLLLVTLTLVLGMAGCVYSQGALAPTPPVDPTLALQTVQAILTQTSPVQPAAPTTAGSITLPATPGRVTPTRPAPSQTPPGSPRPTIACDLASAGSPIDVTIPDDTVLTPGQVFTKIWKLENAGACTWNTDYAAVFLYGEVMDALEVVPLTSNVSPGQSVEIGVEMIAPSATGDYQSNWKLRNGQGDLFGIGPAGESPFWVRVVVAEPQAGGPTATSLPTITPTPTPTPPPTPIPSPTPQVAIQSQLVLEVDYLLDLDLAQPNPNGGADLAYRTGSITFHWLIPVGEAVLGVFGSQQPSLPDCQLAAMSAASIPVESLAPMLYLCYRTNEGQFGWLQLTDFNAQTFSLSLNLLTWNTP